MNRKMFVSLGIPIAAFKCLILATLVHAQQKENLPQNLDEDETFGPNRDFHEHLERLKIQHTWTVLPSVGHNPMITLESLGDSNWVFYRDAFGDQVIIKPNASKS